MRIVMIASEAAPYGPRVGASALVGALPRALASRGHRVSVLLPLHRFMRESFSRFPEIGPVPVRLHDGREEAHILRANEEPTGVEIFAIEADRYFDRPGVYGEGGVDYADSVRRFAFFCRAALGVIDALAISPDVIQCHDWPTALVPIYLRGGMLGDDAAARARDELARASVFLAVADVTAQGEFPSPEFAVAGVPRRVVSPGRIESRGVVNLLREGLERADAVTTLSPRFARDLRDAETGRGLEDVFEKRAAVVSGILSGIDVDWWNPSSDPHLVAPYSAAQPGGKRRCKADLLLEMDLSAELDAPLVGVLSPLTSNSGFDVLLGAIPVLLERGVRLAVAGEGDPKVADALQRIADTSGGRLAFRRGRSEALEHKILGGADMLLMPHVYEAGGSLPMQALRYGAVPVVRPVGALADAVLDVRAIPDRGTGFWIGAQTGEAVLDALARATEARRDASTWTAILRRGMTRELSWRPTAARYVQLYRRLAGGAEAGPEWLSIEHGSWHGRVADTFTHERVRAVAQGFAEQLFEEDPAHALAQRGVLVAHDTRLLGSGFAASVAGVLAWNDVPVVWGGAPASLPAVSCTVAARGLSGAVVVTGEANDSSWNGLHLLGPEGAPLETDAEQIVMDRARLWLGRSHAPQELAVKEAAELGLRREVNPSAIHRDVLESLVDVDAIRSSRLRVACDLNWGAARGVLDRLLREWGVGGDVFHGEADPSFGGIRPDPTTSSLAALAATVASTHDLGIALDPSGTRLGVVDREGVVLAPDHVLALVVDHVAETRGRGRSVVARSVATSRLIDVVASRRGFEVIETPTGFQELGATLARGDASFAVDVGSFAWADSVPHPDAILAALLVVEMIAYRRRSLTSQLEELFRDVAPLAPVRRRLERSRRDLVDLKSRLARRPGELATLHIEGAVSLGGGTRFRLEGGAWVFVRPDFESGFVEIAAEAETTRSSSALVDAAQAQFVT